MGELNGDSCIAVKSCQ